MNAENRIKQIVNFHWKGTVEYDKLGVIEKLSWTKPYSIEELYRIVKESYNLGVEMSAEAAEAKQEYNDLNPKVWVDKESILKLRV